MYKIIGGVVILSLFFTISNCKKVERIVSEKEEKFSILSGYNFEYIIIKNSTGDTIEVMQNPYILSNGVEFALNHLNAIKYSLINNEIFFVPPERKNAFLNKINATMNKINVGEIEDAREKIINDVLPHAKKWVRGNGRYGVIRALEACNKRA